MKYKWNALTHLDPTDLATCPCYANAMIVRPGEGYGSYSFVNEDTTHAEDDMYRVLDGVTGTVVGSDLVVATVTEQGNYDTMPVSYAPPNDGGGYRGNYRNSEARVDLQNAFNFKSA